MPASSTRDLRNFKAHFRRATAAILVQAGVDQVALERALARLKTRARLEITFDLGEALNVATLPSGAHVYDFFAARLRIRVVTGRGQTQAAPLQEAADLHEQIASTVLDCMAEENSPYSAALLPYYSVKTIRPVGTRSDLDINYLEDYTDIDFHLEFGIRSDAWPT